MTARRCHGPGSCGNLAVPDAMPVRPIGNIAHQTGASHFCSNTEAADFLRLSPRTLEKLRVIGGGPPYRKLGRRVVYALADLEEWAARRRCESTSDPHPRR